MTLGPLMVDIDGTALSDADRKILRHPMVGGVILFTRNYEDIGQLTRLTAEIKALRRPPLLIAVDQEGGRVQRFKQSFTRLPPASLLGRVHDIKPAEGLKLAQTLGWLMAAELRSCGIDLSFAPVVDLDHGKCEVIGDRASHSDARTVARLAAAFVDGMHDAGMKATAKHFPGHGAVNEDSHQTLPVDDRDRAAMAPDLLPYQYAVERGLDGIMMALVSYPAIDEKPASFSSIWIREHLRQRLGFDGAVFSDDLSMAGASIMGSMRRRTAMAIAAGCDMVLICNDRDAVEQVLARLDTDHPASQARRAALHGSKAQTWERLLKTSQWKQARQLVTGYAEQLA